MHYRIDKDRAGKLSIPDGKKFDTLWQVNKPVKRNLAKTSETSEAIHTVLVKSLETVRFLNVFNEISG